MKLSPAAFVTKWSARFANNDQFKIGEADLREFATDIADSFGVTVANVPYYMPNTLYGKDYLVRYIIAGQAESFYYSLKTGLLPAPTGASDVNWRVVPGPVVSTALSQSLTLLEAQGIEGRDVVAGRTYLIDFGPDANGYAQVVTLLGTAANLFAIRGQLTVNGVRSNVRVNVASGVFGEEVSNLLDKDNAWAGTNTFSKAVSVLDLTVTSVQNLALNTFSKLAAFVTNLVPRLGATTATDPAAPLSKLPIAGYGMQQTGNAIGLLRNANQIVLSPGTVDTSLLNGNFVSGVGNATTSPLIEVDPALTITFLKPVAQVTFYTASQAYLSNSGTVSASIAPPATAKYMRVVAKTTSGSDTARIGVATVYSEASYSIGRLPYVIGLQTSSGPVYPGANGIVDASTLGGGVATPAGTVLTFTQDAEYAPIYSGTFTADPTGAKVGVVVRAELGSATTEPTLDATKFDLISGAYQAGKRLGYAFCVAASGKIEYLIYPKP